MSDILYLAWRYLSHHKLQTLVLVLAVALTVYIPTTLAALVRQSQAAIQRRAEQTPLIIGAKGSRVELVLSSLYYTSPVREPLPAKIAEDIQNSQLGLAIPIHARFQASGAPVVGTNTDYLEFRGLEIKQGRAFTDLGECVLGAQVAQDLDLEPGDSLMSRPETAFDIAGVYPLKMRVVGVLIASGTPDDTAVFTDIKTTWIIEGLGHGHNDLADPSANASVLEREGNNITANASVFLYNEIDPTKRSAFHFHGDPSTFPLTAVIVEPYNAKGQALLMGRYTPTTSDYQAVRPIHVVDELMDSVFTVQRLVVLALLLVSVATAVVIALVIQLSIRLRKRELHTLSLIGAKPIRIAAIITIESGFTLIIGTAVGLSLAMATARYSEAFVQWMVTL